MQQIVDTIYPNELIMRHKQKWCYNDKSTASQTIISQPNLITSPSGLSIYLSPWIPPNLNRSIRIQLMSTIPSSIDEELCTMYNIAILSIENVLWTWNCTRPVDLSINMITTKSCVAWNWRLKFLYAEDVVSFSLLPIYETCLFFIYQARLNCMYQLTVLTEI